MIKRKFNRFSLFTILILFMCSVSFLYSEQELQKSKINFLVPKLSLSYDWRGKIIDVIGYYLLRNKIDFLYVNSNIIQKYKERMPSLKIAWQQNGFIKVVSQEELFGGCKALEMEHLFGDGILKKTIWPCDWTAQQIMEAVKEAWHNQIFIHKEIFQGSTVLTVHGKTSANIEIEMIIKVISENKIKLKTAYPYNPKFSRYPRES